MNLRYAFYDKLKTNDNKIDEFKLEEASKYVGIECEALKAFIIGEQINISSKILKELCFYFDININEIHKGYFQ